MRIFKLVGKGLSTVLIIILAIVLGCNIYTIAAKNLGHIEYPTILGFYPAVVISGSMSGSIEVNDMVIAHQQSDYSVGDVISYKTESNLVTHRIVDEMDEGFITKGDANNTEDREIVKEEQILGKVVLVIPRIGIIGEFMHTPLGMCIAVLLIFLILFFPSSHDKRNKKQAE